MPLDPAEVGAHAGTENFPIASLLFPRALRPHLHAIYGFARLVDILGDEWEGDRLAVLDELERGRVYLPAEDRRRFGVTELDRPSGPIRALMAFETERARGLLASGAPLGAALGGRMGRAVALFARGGLAALDQLERLDYDVFTRRPVPPRRRLAWEAVKAAVS